MKDIAKPKITIIGAGLTGCFLAILLARRGYAVDLYDKLSKAEIVAGSSKRSVNLTFFSYGVLALKDAGVWKAIKPHLIKLKGSVTYVADSTSPITARLHDKKMPYFTMQRSLLLKILLQHVRLHPSISVFYNTTLVSVDRYRKTILLRKKSGKLVTRRCEVVIGTDGVHSVVRGFLQQGQATTHLQEHLPWSYKQIELTRTDVQKLGLFSDYMYAWTRKDAVLTAFPNRDGSFAAMLTLPREQRSGFSSLSSEQDVKRFITKTFPSILPVLPGVTRSILENPEGYFVTVNTNPWYYKDFMVILGDAAHGFLPFFGQGMSAAFGDSRKLVKLLDKYNADFGKVFPLFQEERKQHTDIMAQLSKDSFIRFRRQKQADYSAVYDRLESLLHAVLPQFFLPSLFTKIAVDPDNAADIVSQYARQRKVIAYTGLSVVARAITVGVEMRETVMRSSRGTFSLRKFSGLSKISPLKPHSKTLPKSTLS